MLYYLHSYAPDAPLLHLCLRRLFELDGEARVIVANDPSKPIPPAMQPKNERVMVIPTPYPCGGNLNGEAMIGGMLRTLIKSMECCGENHIVKMDCDTWLNNVDWLRVGNFATEGMPEPDYVGLERAEPLTASGACYRISLYAARAALKGLRGRQWPQRARLPEDRTILDLIMRARLPILTVPHLEGKFVGMHAAIPGKRETSAWAVHCGETCEDGTRASRDFVLLRMRLMEAACLK